MNGHSKNQAISYQIKFGLSTFYLVSSGKENIKIL